MVHGFTTEKRFDHRHLVCQHWNQGKTYLKNHLNEFVSCSLFNGFFFSSGCRCAYFSCKRWRSRSCYACLQGCSRMASWVWQRCRHWLGIECFCFRRSGETTVSFSFCVVRFASYWQGHHNSMMPITRGLIFHRLKLTQSTALKQECCDFPLILLTLPNL